MHETWTFVDSHDIPTGATFTGPASALAANTPAGCRAVEGLLDIPPRQDPELIRSRIIERLEAIERKSLRRMRELLAAGDPQMKALDDEAATLRAQL